MQPPPSSSSAVSMRPLALLDAGWRMLRRAGRRALGLPAAMDTPDRRLLEGCILPHYRGRAEVRTLLFVGTRWYTRHYAQPWLHLPGRRFLTLDVDPAAARHGSPQGHLVASAADVAAHLAPGSVDVVVFNGVYGWGLDDAAVLEQALRGFHTVLGAQGELVFGWNDLPRRRPFGWHGVPALRRFAPQPFPPLGTASLRLPGANRHCFDFFRKAAGARSVDAPRPNAAEAPQRTTA